MLPNFPAPVQAGVAMHVMGSVYPADDLDGTSFHEGVAVAEATPPTSSSTFSHDGKNGTILLDNPPPPPAPPPPPPPPPPLLPNPGVLKKKKKRVRSFFWKTIPAEKVKGHANLWTQGQVQQDFQIDVQKIEELFTQKDAPPASTTALVRGGKARVSFREARDEVSILDSKRGLNIAIFLKQFKRSNQALVDDVRRGNSESFGAEPLRELLKLLPEKEEVKKLKAYRGDVAKLSLADSFIYLLTQLPSYSVRIESMLLKEEFPGACQAMKQEFKILRSAVKELMCCKELHAVLHLVLQAGNILNAGGSAGNAVGFKLSSLLSLADTKANKPGMNLLHFVALEAQKKDQKLLEFPLKLSNIQAASRISIETLDADLQLLTSRTRSVEESIQKDTELLQQLDAFLQSATSSLCSLRGSQQQLRKEGRELIDFFCEDRDSFRLDDCFSIFHTFCTRFTNAAKENEEREAKEAARRQRMHEDELKRHSWSGGEEVTGAIGWRCRSETDMSAAASREETGKLLTPRSLTPRSSSFNTNHVHQGRSGNLRRSRNSPSSSPSLAAERALSALLGSSSDLVVSRRRGHEDTKRPFPRGSGLSPTKVLASPTSAGRNPESSDEALKDVSKDEDLVRDGGNNRADPSFRSQEELPNNPTLSSSRNQGVDQTSHSMSVLLERCTLVPELKAFDGPGTRTGRGEVTHCHSDVSHRHDDAVAPGPEDKGVDEAQSDSLQTEKKNAEEPEVKVIVWCVTGVCDASGENAHPRVEEDRKVPKEEQETSCNVNGGESSDCRPDGETTASFPISSQPVSVSRRNDSTLPASSPGLHPAKPAAANQEKEEAAANPVAEADKSTNPRADAAAGSQQTSDGGVGTKTSKQRTVEGSSTKTKPEASTRSSSRKILNSRTGSTGMKPLTSTGSRSVRTLTTSENQNMRRVVPITRVSPASSTRNPERPPAQSRASSRTAGPNASSSSIRRGAERPRTAPLSRELAATKTAESKELREQKASGREQNPAVRKPVMKPRTQTEEKICVSKLRALNREGGVGSASAPVTPLHKSRTATSSSSAVPGFTRNTASSSFRRTKPSLQPSSTSPKPSSSSSSPLRRPQSSRSLAPSPLHSSLVPPRGHRRNDSGSDKSAHSRDSGKPSRPSWR